MKRLFYTITFLVLITLIFPFSSEASDSLQINVGDGLEGKVGDQVTVPIIIASLPDNYCNSLITFGLVVTYDPDILKIKGVSAGNLGQASEFDSNYSLAPDIFDHRQGKLVISYSTANTGIQATGTIYNLQFTILQRPESGESVIGVGLRVQPDGSVFDEAGNEISAAFQSSAISITVPEEEWPGPTAPVAINKEWTVRFNLPVDTSALDSSMVSISKADGTPFAIDILPGNNNASIILKPVQNYEPGQSYYLSIKNVPAQNGRKLNKIVTMHFTTEDI